MSGFEFLPHGRKPPGHADPMVSIADALIGLRELHLRNNQIRTLPGAVWESVFIGRGVGQIRGPTGWVSTRGYDAAREKSD